MFFPAITRGQKNDFPTRYYGKEDGLDRFNNVVFCQDNNGVIYAAGSNKIYRFDGVKFSLLKTHDPAIDTTILHTETVSFAVDGENNIWYGGKRGARCYNHEKNTVEAFLPDTTKPDVTLANRYVQAIKVDYKDNLWFTQWHGVSYYDKSTGEFTNYNIQDSIDGKAGGFSALALDEERKTLWTGDWRGNLVSMNLETHHVRQYQEESSRTSHAHVGRIPTIMIDKEGLVWICTWNQGIKCFDPSTGKFTYYDTGSNPFSLLSNRVHDIIYHPSRNEYWISTENGINIINFDEGYNHIIVNDENELYNIPENNVTALFLDDQEGVWMSVYRNGVFYCHPGETVFKPYVPRFDCNSNYTISNIRGFFEYPEGHIWFNTFQGPAILNTRKNEFLDPTDLGIDSIQGKEIYQLKITANGKLYFFMHEEFIEFDTISKKYKVFELPPELVTFNSHDKACEIISGNRFIVSRNRIGVFIFDPGIPIFELLEMPGYNLQGQTTADMFHLNDDVVQFSNFGSVFYYNHKSNELKVSKIIDVANEEACFPHGSIQVSPYDSSSLLVLSKGLGGFFKLYPGNCKYEHITAKNGLYSNSVEHLLLGDDHDIWLFCDEVITRYNLQKRAGFHFSNYHEGLIGESFATSTVFRSSSGKVYVSLKTGVVVFNPGDIKIDTIPPKVSINKFYINDSLQVPGISRYMNNVDWTVNKLLLDHSDNSFGFEFLVTDYSNPSKCQYKYMLEGYDNDWTLKKYPENHGEYMNLPPGEYRLVIQASNSYGIWNKEGAVLDITIKAPFWMKWWFIGSVVAGVIILVFLFARYKEMQSRKEQEKLRAQVDEAVKEAEKQKEELEKTFNELVKKEEQERLNNWYTNGLAQLGKIISSEKDSVNTLARAILTELVSYLEASQGGIYILNEDDENKSRLELVASYAFPRYKLDNPMLGLDEKNLVTDCFKANKTNYTRIQDNYLELESGLGKERARFLILVPLKFEDVMLGVIEIASFNPMERFKINLLEEISDRVASTINVIRMTEKNNRLLNDSREQEEELRQKEEELKTNLQEINDMKDKMEAIHQSADQKHQEMIKNINEQKESVMDILNAYNGKIFIKNKNGEIYLANDAKASAHGLSRKEILGKTDEELFGKKRGKEYRSEDLEVLKSQKQFRMIDQVKEKGVTRYYEVIKKPILITNIKEEGLLCIERDITSEVEMEEKLKELQQEYDQLIQKQG